MNLILLSENTLLLLFEQKISHQIYRQVTRHVEVIEAELSDYIIDIVPSYASIQILFNLTKISGKDFQHLLQNVVADVSLIKQPTSNKKIAEIPVYYGPEVALDIALVASYAGLTIDEVIARHSAITYDVYATGFAPGFCYLGIVDECIAMPRKDTPRTKVSKGSLGIADQQTAIYPADSPGGWQIIGKTPISMIDYSSEQITRFTTGDKIKFIAISKADFLKLGGRLE